MCGKYGKVSIFFSTNDDEVKIFNLIIKFQTRINAPVLCVLFLPTLEFPFIFDVDIRFDFDVLLKLAAWCLFRRVWKRNLCDLFLFLKNNFI